VTVRPATTPRIFLMLRALQRASKSGKWPTGTPPELQPIEKAHGKTLFTRSLRTVKTSGSPRTQTLATPLYAADVLRTAPHAVLRLRPAFFDA
jgi:hypothetical protein